jgi:hypothetical protein
MACDTFRGARKFPIQLSKGLNRTKQTPISPPTPLPATFRSELARFIPSGSAARPVTNYPQLEARLKVLPRLGTPIVLMRPYCKHPATPYDNKESSRHVRKARHAVGLGEHVTLSGCRHGGMPLLGDAALTEQQTMALSGHTTPAAARGYVKRTQKQRVSGARRRRDFIDEAG